MSLKKKVMSGLRWTAGAKFLGQLITWSITIVVIRLLSPADYGLMSLASVFVSFLAMLSELGLGAAVVQRRDLCNNTLRSLFGLVLLVSMGFYLMLVSAAPFIAGFYDEPRLIPLVRVLALQFLLVGFAVLPQSLLLRDMEFRTIATVDFISSITGSITTLVLVLAGYGVWSLIWGALMIRVVSLVCFNLAKPFLCVPRVNREEIRAVFSFSGYVTLSRIFWYLYSNADVLIIGKLLGKDLLGFYSVGIYIASLPMEKVSGIINQVAFPAFASVQSDPGMAGQHFLKAVRVMSFFSFPVLWGISSIAPEFISVFLGAKWNSAALSLQVVAFIIPLRMVSNLMSPAALGAGRPDISFQNSLVAFVLMPVSFVIGSSWGLLGVSSAWVIAFPIVFCLNLLRVTKIMEITLIDVLRAIHLPLWTGLIMFGCVMFIKTMLISGVQNIPKMLMLVGSGAVVYIAMSLIFNRSGLREVRELAKA